VAKERMKLTLANVMAVTKNAPLQEKKEDDTNIENIEEVPKKVKLKDLEKKCTLSIGMERRDRK